MRAVFNRSPSEYTNIFLEGATMEPEKEMNALTESNLYVESEDFELCPNCGSARLKTPNKVFYTCRDCGFSWDLLQMDIDYGSMLC